MKQQTKDIIFNGALKAFSERGFNETNMEEIAKVCGIAKGTLYYNFKNKQELYIYILKMGMERFVQDIHEAMAQTPKDQVELRIRKLIQVHIEFIGREPDFCRLLVSKGWVSQEQHFNIRQVLADYFDFMEAEIESGKFYGKISSKLDAKTTANCLFGIYIFTPMRSMVWGETMNLQEVRESIELFVCNALGIYH